METHDMSSGSRERGVLADMDNMASTATKHVHKEIFQCHAQRLPSIPLLPYVNQVGGHSALLRFSETTICKPLIEKEQVFYDYVDEHTTTIDNVSMPGEQAIDASEHVIAHDDVTILKTFMPQFYGQINVTFGGYRRDTSTSKKEGSPCQAIRPLEDPFQDNHMSEGDALEDSWGAPRVHLQHNPMLYQQWEIQKSGDRLVDGSDAPQALSPSIRKLRPKKHSEEPQLSSFHQMDDLDDDDHVVFPLSPLAQSQTPMVPNTSRTPLSSRPMNPTTPSSSTATPIQTTHWLGLKQRRLYHVFKDALSPASKKRWQQLYDEISSRWNDSHPDKHLEQQIHGMNKAMVTSSPLAIRGMAVEEEQTHQHAMTPPTVRPMPMSVSPTTSLLQRCSDDQASSVMDSPVPSSASLGKDEESGHSSGGGGGTSSGSEEDTATSNKIRTSRFDDVDNNEAHRPIAQPIQIQRQSTSNNHRLLSIPTIHEHGGDAGDVRADVAGKDTRTVLSATAPATFGTYHPPYVGDRPGKRLAPAMADMGTPMIHDSDGKRQVRQASSPAGHLFHTTTTRRPIMNPWSLSIHAKKGPIGATPVHRTRASSEVLTTAFRRLSLPDQPRSFMRSTDMFVDATSGAMVDTPGVSEEDARRAGSSHVHVLSTTCPATSLPDVSGSLSSPHNSSMGTARSTTVLPYVLLEDLSADLEIPCILDLKVGKRMFGVHATEKKRKSQQRKVMSTTSGTLGVRVCGMQLYDLVEERYYFQDKYQGRALDTSGFDETLTTFLRPLPASALRYLLKRLEVLRDVLGRLTPWRFYCASVILLYDAAATTASASTSSHKARAGHAGVKVKLVDFAHSLCPTNYHTSLRTDATVASHNDNHDGWQQGLTTITDVVRRILCT